MSTKTTTKCASAVISQLKQEVSTYGHPKSKNILIYVFTREISSSLVSTPAQVI